MPMMTIAQPMPQMTIPQAAPRFTIQQAMPQMTIQHAVQPMAMAIAQKPGIFQSTAVAQVIPSAVGMSARPLQAHSQLEPPQQVRHQSAPVERPQSRPNPARAQP